MGDGDLVGEGAIQLGWPDEGWGQVQEARGGVGPFRCGNLASEGPDELGPLGDGGRTTKAGGEGGMIEEGCMRASLSERGWSSLLQAATGEAGVGEAIE